MKIAVLVKEVPDTYGDRVLDLETGLINRDASERVLDEIGERAIEVALKYSEEHPGTEVALVSMSPEDAVTSIRKGLAMGAHTALHVVDDDLTGADMLLTAEVLAAAIQRVGADLVIAGNVSTDGGGGVVPAMIAELLNVPQLTALSSLVISQTSVTGERASDAGIAQVSATLPAVVSVTEALPEARFPNFKGIMAAKKKPIDTMRLAELGIDPLDPDAARTIMTAVTAKPARTAGMKITDEGDGGRKLAEFLFENRLA